MSTNPTLRGIPQTVQVLVNKYTIVLIPDLHHSDGEKIHGMCSTQNKIITLDESGSANMAEVLLHELLHALWYEKGLSDFTKLNEEQTVNGLSIGLTLLMRDNPKLRTYLSREWGKV